MEFYSIKGGNPLCGEVDIAGAKNAALPILSAAIMTNETVLVENVPDVSDIRAILSAIESIGAIVTRVDRHTFRINGSQIVDGPREVPPGGGDAAEGMQHRPQAD